MELNKIFNEDCLLTMQKIENNTIDAIITSPPYNTSRKGSILDSKNKKIIGGNIRYDDFDDMKSDDEYIKWTIDIFNGYNKILKKNGIILYNLSYSSENTNLIWKTINSIIINTDFSIADTIIWKKSSALPNVVSPNKLTRICEFVFVICRKNDISSFNCNKEISSFRENGQKIYKNYFNFIEAPNNDETIDIHKATYSTKLVRSLIQLYVKKGQIVYDSFMGTGTTAIGCIREGVNYIGSELSKRYVNHCEERIRKEKSQLNLF